MGIFDNMLVKYGAVMCGYAIVGLPVFGPNSAAYLKKAGNNQSQITKDYVRNSSLLINLSKAVGRVVASYQDIQNLAGLLQKASTFSQIIITTPSAGLVSAFTPEDIIVVENQDNASVFKRLNDIDLDNWLTEYSLGQLWENNVFGGRP
jgi:ABC-type uncharacterized transport system fused permease/ATPase subunit